MEAATRPVLQNIVEQCLNAGVQVSNALAAMVLRASILKTADGMQMETALKKCDLPSLVKTCVERLIAKNSPSLETMKQQVIFESKLISEHERLEEKTRQHSHTTKNMLSEIGGLNAKSYAALEVLYRKAVAYMIFTSKLGDVGDPVAVKEATLVLETVFPREELQAFLACQRQEREFQMDELSVIVAGIRLLNKAQGKGGDCIEDAPRFALATSADLEAKLTKEIDTQQTILDNYMAVLARLYQSPEENERINRLQDESNNHQQFLSHATLLLEDVTELKDRLTELKGLHQESINGLTQAASGVDAKPLPPEKIYPMFMTLAKIWQQIEKERTQLQARANLFQCLMGMKSGFVPTLTAQEADEASSNFVPDTVSVAKFLELEATKNTSDATVIDAKNISGISALEFKGFCPWTVIQRNGMLIKGDSTNAVVRYQGKYYAFASDQAIGEFMDNPAEYTESVIALAKDKAELIFLLDLQNAFPAMQSINSSLMKKGKGARVKSGISTSTGESLKRDSETQTETHPVPSYIDRNYCWNEWELRRNAIKLVELRYKATHSTQTKNSHFRRENATQHYPPKDNDTQTGISTGTSPKINKNYIAGLRGKPTQKVKVVKLELDL